MSEANRHDDRLPRLPAFDRRTRPLARTPFDPQHARTCSYFTVRVSGFLQYEPYTTAPLSRGPIHPFPKPHPLLSDPDVAVAVVVCSRPPRNADLEAIKLTATCWPRGLAAVVTIRPSNNTIGFNQARIHQL